MVTWCWCAHLNILVPYRRVPHIFGWMEGNCASSTRFHKTQMQKILLSSETLLGLRMTGWLLHTDFTTWSTGRHELAILWNVYFSRHNLSTYCSLSQVKPFTELVPQLFAIPGVKVFLSEWINQGPLEKFFGCQRQRGGWNENPTVAEFYKNTQARMVINSFCVGPVKGKCQN